MVLFRDEEYETTPVDYHNTWQTDFNKQCSLISSTDDDPTDISVWSNAVKFESPVVTLVNLLRAGLPGANLILPIDIWFRSSMQIRYAITPCTTVDGNYAMVIGLAFRSGECTCCHCC